MFRRRRRTVVWVLLLISGLLVVVDFAQGFGKSPEPVLAVAQPKLSVPALEFPDPAPVSASAVATPSAAQPSASPQEPNPSPQAIAFAHTGSGVFTYSRQQGPVLGKAGKLRKFRVAVENGIQQDVEGFAANVDEILGDARSWTASGDLRLQRVPQGGEFTIYLATEATSEKMCLEDGLQTDKYTSCRVASGKVVINLARWMTSVPHYGAPLGVYRQYVINHEVGHQLGYGHERCPTAGGLAPVMQQQTLGLYGCVANAWPYVNGRRLTGPPGSYTVGN
jgi:hypothetical protein